MAVRARHDVHEGEGDIIFIDLVARHLAAQDPRKKIRLIIGWACHHVSPCLSRKDCIALQNPSKGAPQLRRAISLINAAVRYDNSLRSPGKHLFDGGPQCLAMAPKCQLHIEWRLSVRIRYAKKSQKEAVSGLADPAGLEIFNEIGQHQRA